MNIIKNTQVVTDPDNSIEKCGEERKIEKHFVD